MLAEIKGAQILETLPKSKTSTTASLRSLSDRNGYAFGLCYINSDKDSADQACDIIEDFVERLANSFGKDANPQHRFEQFLGAINEEFSYQVKEGQIDFQIKDMSAVVGIVTDDIMYLSGTGDLTILFLHNRSQDRYQVYNLSRSIQTEQALPTWEKTFAVLLDGELKGGDVFCVSNLPLQQSLPSEELNSILATLPPRGAAEKIRQYLPPKGDLAILVIGLKERKSAENLQGAKPLSELSLNNLGAISEETEQILEDQRPKPISGLIDKFFSKNKKQKDIKDDGKPKAAVTTIKRIYKISKLIILGIASVTVNLFHFVKNLISSFSKKGSRERPLSTFKSRIDQGVTRSLNNFKGMPKISKRLGFAAIGILIIFIVSISFISSSKARSEDNQAYVDQVKAVEQKRDEAQAAIIYKDENRAKRLFEETMALLNQLPIETEEQQANKTRLLDDIQKGQDELRHIIDIPNPNVFADLNSSFPGVRGQGLILADNVAYIMASDKNIYRAEKNSSQPQAVETSPDTGVPAFGALEDGNIYFYDNQNAVHGLSTDDLTFSPDLLNEEGEVWADIEAYSSRLYVLKPKGNESQIVRYNNLGSGFSSGADWIQSRETDLSDAVSLAIDGTVFVLKRNGKVARFSSGSEIGWDLGVVDPPITQASRFWTDLDSNFVYILEPSTTRLLVFRKDSGAFVVQYKSEKFGGVTDFAIDESTRTAYMMVGPRVYTFTMEHL